VAIWFFLVCAHDTISKVPTQITVDDEEDQRVNLVNVARAIAMAGGVTVDQMFESEIVRRAIAEAGDKLHPRIRSFILSGGKTYAAYDRDPDSHATAQ
jgi:hypothetical protein